MTPTPTHIYFSVLYILMSLFLNYYYMYAVHLLMTLKQLNLSKSYILSVDVTYMWLRVKICSSALRMLTKLPPQASQALNAGPHLTWALWLKP